MAGLTGPTSDQPSAGLSGPQALGLMWSSRGSRVRKEVLPAGWLRASLPDQQQQAMASGPAGLDRGLTRPGGAPGISPMPPTPIRWSTADRSTCPAAIVPRVHAIGAERP